MVCASAMHERYDDEKHAGGKNVCTKGYFENWKSNTHGVEPPG